MLDVMRILKFMQQEELQQLLHVAMHHLLFCLTVCYLLRLPFLSDLSALDHSSFVSCASAGLNFHCTI